MRSGSLPLASLALAAVLLVGCAPYPAPGSTPSGTPSRSAAPTADASNTPTPTPSATPAASCDEISTDALKAEVAARQWKTWALPSGGVDFNPFDEFFDGRPAGSLVCRSAASLDAAADDMIDIAWTPTTAAAATAAQARLETNGYQRTEAPEGVYLSLLADYGFGDAEGFAQTYLFTPDEVRWAISKADLRFVKSPDPAP